MGIRLVGGVKSYQGTVEIYYKGQWGSICDDLWDIEDANVVCRQLGFGEALEASLQAQFGRSTVDPIHFDDVKCQGSESKLSECVLDTLLVCHHGEDAGVICAPPPGQSIIQFRQSDWTKHDHGQIWLSLHEHTMTEL